MHAAFAALGTEAISAGFGTALVSGIFAGWLIALMVWLLPFAETGRVAVIIIITYVIGIGHFLHSIAGSIEVLYLVMSGGASLGDFLMKFFIPVLLGNVIGGVALVAAINYAQVAAGEGVEG